MIAGRACILITSTTIRNRRSPECRPDPAQCYFGMSSRIAGTTLGWGRPEKLIMRWTIQFGIGFFCRIIECMQFVFQSDKTAIHFLQSTEVSQQCCIQAIDIMLQMCKSRLNAFEPRFDGLLLFGGRHCEMCFLVMTCSRNCLKSIATS